MADDDRIRIGELASRAGVTVRTVRYYEGLGLIAPERAGGGQRYYDARAVARLQKIEQLKRLGLGLDEIGGVIDLYFSDPTGVRAKRRVLAILRRHLDELDARVASLEGLRAELRAHVARFEAWLSERNVDP